LYDKVSYNWKIKRSHIAKTNGKKSSDVLKSVELKPLSSDIQTWFKEQIDAGKYKWQIRKELQNVFGYGERKYYQLCKLIGVPNENPQTGNLNSMYGRSPALSAGSGISGWILINGHKVHFRSMLELRVYLYLDLNNIRFVLSTHRIPYSYKEADRTYCPDIVIDNTIYEIKPSKLTSNEEVQTKFIALQNYCRERNLFADFITEHTYNLPILTIQWIDELISQNKLAISEKNYTRLIKNI
jgi:hypothetical protein